MKLYILGYGLFLNSGESKGLSEAIFQKSFWAKTIFSWKGSHDTFSDDAIYTIFSVIEL